MIKPRMLESKLTKLSINIYLKTPSDPLRNVHSKHAEYFPPNLKSDFSTLQRITLTIVIRNGK